MKELCSKLQKDFLRRIGNLHYLTARADGEPSTSTGDANSSSSDFDLSKLLSQARQEEKDKLYPELQRLKSENNILQKQANDAIMEAGKVKQEFEDYKKKNDKNSSDEITKLQAKIEALEEENKKLKESAPKEEDIRKQLEAEFEVKSYLKDKLAENKGKILSVYAKQVKGKTKEEIDEAIKKAIKDSDEIRKEVNGGEETSKDENKDTSSKNDDAETKKDENSKKRPPANNPSLEVGGNKYSLEYVQGLDPLSKEYEEFRKKIGLKGKR